MCGRFVSPDIAAIEATWHIGRRNSNPFRQRYNVLPTTDIPLLRWDEEAGLLELATARWGMIPHWWSKPKLPTSTINARSEEAANKPMWRDAYRQSRCLIPAVGWYEWKPMERTDPKTGEIQSYKQPYYLKVKDRAQPVVFAGLMSWWRRPGEEPKLTCALMTRAPSPSAAEVHDRMPVILDEAAHREWLDPKLKDAKRVGEIATQAAIGEVVHFPVSTRLNSAKTDEEDLIRPIGPL